MEYVPFPEQHRIMHICTHKYACHVRKHIFKYTTFGHAFVTCRNCKENVSKLVYSVAYKRVVYDSILHSNVGFKFY